jgi:YebC/PmpR family DNA-binding regulatory protein
MKIEKYNKKEVKTMGRAHEVRAKRMAQTNAAKSALFNRASKEIYLAAKSGVPDPKENLALRSAIEKWKAQHVTRDVIDRAVAKAKSKDSADFIPGRYEGFGPAGVAIMVDTLSDNEKRAFSAVRACFTHHGGNVGNSGCAAFNFQKMGVISFDSDKATEEIEESLIMNDVDLQNVDKDENTVVIQVTPEALNHAREVCVSEFGVGEDDFSTCEVTFVPTVTVDNISDDDKDKLQKLIDDLDECEDVQGVYHNGNL